MIWRCVGASVVGAGHIARSEGGHDAHRLEVLDGGTVIVAVADGAGSAPRAADGSAIAVDAAIDVLSDAPRDVLAALAVARRSLEDDLDAQATTLLVVSLMADGRLTCAQVGDGAIVARGSDGSVTTVSGGLSRAGEYLNETTFLTSPGWEAAMEIGGAESIDAIAALTDGLQLVAFDLAAGGTPHAAFFDPLWTWCAGGEAGTAELAGFLSSERMAARADDDLTLVLATRDSRSGQ